MLVVVFFIIVFAVEVNEMREEIAQKTVLSSSPPPLPGRTPKLSYVSLAFLEACCRSEPDLQWRVYDVCSVMRMQKERKVQESLDRPQKVSHHVLGSVQEF